MTNEEFDLMDELYFVKTFQELEKELQWQSDKLKNELYLLIKKDWVKCFLDLSEVERPSNEEFLNLYSKYQYIATKKGLLAHNRK